jgi:LacI family transcriptional regulator
VGALFTDPYIPRLLQGITQACNTHNYTLSLFLLQTIEEEAKLYPRILRTQLFDGVIIQAAQMGDPLIGQMVEHNVPFVMIGRPLNASHVSFVNPDNMAAAHTAVNHLIQLGYKRIATIAGPQNTTAGLDRRQGYLDALRARNYKIDEELIMEGDFTETGGYIAMQKLLPRHPEAVFVASDTMAFGALRALRQAGVSVPRDIAMIGFDDLPTAATADPPLTTIRQPILRIGTKIVDTLIDVLNTGPKPPRHIKMPTELVIRESCGAR